MNKILVYDFRLLESIRFEVKDNQVLVTMKGNKIYERLRETISDERIHDVGDPISSAIACILTKLKLVPIIIKSYNHVSNNIIRVEYEIKEK